jgi:nucleotide sugar dehydrogenase
MDMEKIVVVGLGYVGLPLLLLAAEKGFEACGLDIDTTKINSLKKGRSYIDDVNDDQVKQSAANYTSDASVTATAKYIIICVPTPVDEHKQPDLSPVRGAIESIAPHLKEGTLVILESTVNPGVCDEVVIPLLESLTSLKVGRDILLAHCPERINPGDSRWNVRNISRVLGANSKKELTVATKLYGKIIEAEIKQMHSLKEAEAVKVVENSFRDINIAFVNELAMSFHKLGIDVENVIDGAATKPFSFMPHRPGCGVGGHCIPVDPYYLIEYANGYGFDHELLSLSRSVNERMPSFTVELLTEALNEKEKPLKGSRISLLGLSYKANIGDSRESPAHVILSLLQQAGAEVQVYDPYITKGSTVSSLDEALKSADAIVVATGHDEFKSITLDRIQGNNISAVVDGRNIFRDLKSSFLKAGISYKGIGI